jgi:hypothetical protein
MAMKGVNLGFASVFFEILTCRALPPSFPIRLGFDFDRVR